MPVIILAGEEEYRIAKEAESLKKKLVDPTWMSFNFQKIHGADLKQIIDAAATVPFGPGNKLVVFEDCALFTKKRGSAKDDDTSSSKAKSDKLLDDLDAALKTMPPNTYLLFCCIANFDSTLKVSKVFLKHCKPSDFPKVKYWPGSDCPALVDFCNREAHEVGATIDDEAAYYLAESTEVDLRMISAEIKKAATFILPEKHIRLDHVASLSPHLSDVFGLMNQWAAGQKADVLDAIRALQSRQVSAHMVIGGAQMKLSKWIEYRTELDKACAVPGGSRDVRRHEVPLRQVAQNLVQNPRMAYAVEQDLKRIKNLSLPYLTEKKRELTELEFLLKSGQMPESHALEHFFTR